MTHQRLKTPSTPIGAKNLINKTKAAHPNTKLAFYQYGVAPFCGELSKWGEQVNTTNVTTENIRRESGLIN